MSIETLLEMSELTIEDIAGRLKVVEDRVVEALTHANTGGKLLLTEEWAAWVRVCQGEGSSGQGRGGACGRSRGRKKKGDGGNGRVSAKANATIVVEPGIGPGIARRHDARSRRTSHKARMMSPRS